MSDVGSRWRRTRRRQRLRGDGWQPSLGTGEQGEFEVRAWIQADLLGVRLLTLKSRMVTGEPGSFRKEPSLVAPPQGITGRSTTATRTAKGLEQAVALLQQSTDTLDRLSLNGRPHGR